MEAYRASFTEKGEYRRPMLTVPREIPFDGEPLDVHNIVSQYSGWLAIETDIPKPGISVIGKQPDFCRARQFEHLFRRID